MRLRITKLASSPGVWLTAIVLGLMLVGKIMGQLQPSGASAVTISSGTVTANAGTGPVTPWKVDLASTGANATAIKVDGTGGSFPVSGSLALAGGVANVGLFRLLPSSCTQSTNFQSGTVGIATGAGTSLTSTTTCVTVAFANNITNSPVTIRLQDKTGTPIIWVGGNADFTIQPNYNVRFPLDGVTFTSGITAIAGTASAINLQVNGVQ